MMERMISFRATFSCCLNLNVKINKHIWQVSPQCSEAQESAERGGNTTVADPVCICIQNIHSTGKVRTFWLVLTASKDRVVEVRLGFRLGSG